MVLLFFEAFGIFQTFSGCEIRLFEARLASGAVVRQVL